MSDRATFVKQNIAEINGLANLIGGVDVFRVTKFGDVFHDSIIEGLRFSAYFSMGGLALKSPNGVAMLGDGCAISCIQRGSERIGWSLGRNDNRDDRITQNLMSIKGIYALAHEFGVGIIPWMDDNHTSFNPAIQCIGSNWYRFYLTPAFHSLCKWAMAHPRLIRSMDRGGGGLGNWQHAAQFGQYIWTD